MKFLSPLFAFIALASAQDLDVFTIGYPTEKQDVYAGGSLIVTLVSKVCFVSLFVAYSLNDRN